MYNPVANETELEYFQCQTWTAHLQLGIGGGNNANFGCAQYVKSICRQQLNAILKLVSTEPASK